MFILTVEGKETEGAYSVQDDHGEQEDLWRGQAFRIVDALLRAARFFHGHA